MGPIGVSVVSVVPVVARGSMPIFTMNAPVPTGPPMSIPVRVLVCTYAEKRFGGFHTPYLPAAYSSFHWSCFDFFFGLACWMNFCHDSNALAADS
jgi:hypothetical protein